LVWCIKGTEGMRELDERYQTAKTALMEGGTKEIQLACLLKNYDDTLDTE
jgi:hypothetical protein